MTRVVFISDNLYFVAGNIQYIYTNKNDGPLTTDSSLYRGIIFNSVTSDACYKLSTNTPSISIKMNQINVKNDTNHFLTLRIATLSHDTITNLSNII